MPARGPSDDLEIALELPVGDRLLRFALLPFAGRGVVLDEGVAEERAGRLRALEALRRVPEGRRQPDRFLMLLVVGVPLDRRPELESLLDAPEAGAERRGDG